MHEDRYRAGGTGAGLDGRRALAGEIRAVATAAVLTDVGDVPIARATELVAEARRLLDASVRSSRYEGTRGLVPGAPDNDVIWETHAVFGRSNPLAPPARVEEAPGWIVAWVRFGGAWEGGPGGVYGGFVAAAFDGVLGRAVLSAGHLAVTRSLSVRYLHPTPLHTDLRIEAVAGTSAGRDVAVTGSMSVGAIVTCEAEAVFTRVDPSRYRL